MTFFNRANPFIARLKERYPLTQPGSSKKTYHLVLEARSEHLPFTVGDALGIYPENDPAFVARLLKALGCSGEERVHHPRMGKEMSLESLLREKVNLARLSSGFLQELPGHERIVEKVAYCQQNDLLDALLDLGPPPSLERIVPHLTPLLPRLYSIASSPLYHPDEVHLTVALSSYEHRGEKRWGVASHFLCHLAKEEETPILCYVQKTPHFLLPLDETPIIMIGPGTGVAPFRAFLQERVAKQARGENWLFFGEREKAHDFFYEAFFLELAERGALTLDLAFSRDQEEKVYVQHKMRERGEALWAWLQRGARLYVCGDADPMAKDVEQVLLEIVCEGGGWDMEGGKEYLKKLRKERRYLLDVY